ncbi:hypothetical protein OM076_10375 [Solirubrobacter ginsenosidimutans]|uniref:Uncharacterized protein n=1 Tax=Solirubrobacter ginsenosidimutans TaxID=490573 RepID=A0A9X3MT07_9ACTN|nr:hypothetical protein [Solirubrobacter ginsenosidimutans]MDA0160670.1 hypothetical protein [Solirubrobacter ginsenosidimutans]
MDEIVTAKDRTALFRQGITVVDAECTAGRLTLEVTGGDDERVRAAVRARFGEEARVEILDSYPRQLYVHRCAGHMEREAGRLQLRWVLWPGQVLADIVVVEDDECVVVLGLISQPPVIDDGEPCDVPTHVYLEQPLGERKVYDACGGDEIRYVNVYAEMEAELAAGTRSSAGG